MADVKLEARAKSQKALTFTIPAAEITETRSLNMRRNSHSKVSERARLLFLSLSASSESM